MFSGLQKEIKMNKNNSCKKRMERFVSRRCLLMNAVKQKYALQAVLITEPVDIRYFAGPAESGSALLITDNNALIFTSRMFEYVIYDEAPGCEVVVGKNFPAEFAEALNKMKYHHDIGFQGDQISWSQYHKLKDEIGRRKLVNIGNTAAAIRAVKEEEVIRIIRECVQIAEKAFIDLTSRGLEFMLSKSEKQLAAELEYKMRMLGADRQGFPLNGIIVASGPNSASCHHSPTDRKPQKGEALLFDWGAEKEGYRSDITRVVFMGIPSDDLQNIFTVVKEANQTGIDMIRSGIMCRDIAGAAWDIVRDAGYGDLIRHGLGHGIGLEIHELPVLKQDTANGDTPESKECLQKNMVVTVEPGIYLDGNGGVRLEDDVLVTAEGAECLSHLPKDLESAILR